MKAKYIIVGSSCYCDKHSHKIPSPNSTQTQDSINVAFQMDRVVLKIPFVFKRGYVRTHVISVTKGPSFLSNKNLTTFYDTELAKFAANGTNYTSIHEAPLPGPAVIDFGITQVYIG